MSNPYGALGNEQYTNADVFRGMQDSGYRQPDELGYLATSSIDYANYGGGSQQPVDAYPDYPASFAMQGSVPYGKAMMPPGFTAQKEMFGSQESGYEGDVLPKEYEEWMKLGPGERIVEERMEADNVVGEGQTFEYEEYFEGYKWVTGMQPYVAKEKLVEKPKVIVKEVLKEVVKPEIVERIIQVPKLEYVERHQVGPTKTVTKEQIVEVPQTVIEERLIHVPKLEIQERLIEIPKIEFRERIEYDDRIEYREVPVDKIIEVPEIEYRIKEVETLVPQTYVQEYAVDKYTEVPIQQIQEVERIEQVPVIAQRPRAVPRMLEQVKTEQVKEQPSIMVQQPVKQQPVQMVQQPVQMVQQPVHMVQSVEQRPMQMVQQPVQQVVQQPIQMASQRQLQMVQQPAVYTVPTDTIVNSYANYEPTKAVASSTALPTLMNSQQIQPGWTMPGTSMSGAYGSGFSQTTGSIPATGNPFAYSQQSPIPAY